MPDTSNKRFRDAMRALMEERKTSFRKLAYRTKASDAEDRGLTTGYLSHLATGRQKETVRAMELIARALGVNPTYFREYREHDAAIRARRLVAARGYDEVITVLDTLERSATRGQRALDELQRLPAAGGPGAQPSEEEPPSGPGAGDPSGRSRGSRRRMRSKTSSISMSPLYANQRLRHPGENRRLSLHPCSSWRPPRGPSFSHLPPCGVRRCKSI